MKEGDPCSTKHQAQRERILVTVESVTILSKTYEMSYINNEADIMGFFFPVIV